MPKISSLFAITQPGSSDVIPIVASGVTSKITIANLFANLPSNILFATDNAYDIGAVAAGRPRNIYVGSNLTLPVTTPTTGIIYAGLSRFIHNYADSTSNSHNTFIGVDAGNFTMGPAGGDADLGSYNTAVGDQVLRVNTTGMYNTGVGAHSFYANTTGFANTAIGFDALHFNTTGQDNTACGLSALYYNTIGGNNTAVGISTLNDNTEGNYNTAVGANALANNILAHSNTAIGTNALLTNTTGGSNVACGAGALYSNDSGGTNSVVGLNAMYSNVSAGDNVAIGALSLFSKTSGNNNTACGTAALYSNVNGGINVALGHSAGYYETGSNKLFIDNVARTNEADGRVKALIYGIFDAATSNQQLRINGNVTLGSAAGVEVTVIDGTGFGAGVASLRLNGLTTAAVSNLVGTLINSPVTGDPTFWIPISIAGSVKYIPAW